MMKTKAIWAAGLSVVLGATLFAYGTEMGDALSYCPETIECPITGEDICKEQCPLVDANRPDCPGKVECPLTGELVCKDECPLVAASADDEALLTCCREE